MGPSFPERPRRGFLQGSSHWATTPLSGGKLRVRPYGMTDLSLTPSLSDQGTAAMAVPNSCDTSFVQACCIDMWKPFKIACYKKLPNADVVVDKSHVIQQLNECIEDVTKRVSLELEAPQSTHIYQNRFLLLKGKERLSIIQNYFCLFNLSYYLGTALYFSIHSSYYLAKTYYSWAGVVESGDIEIEVIK